VRPRVIRNFVTRALTALTPHVGLPTESSPSAVTVNKALMFETAVLAAESL
jgi:hypothetical protein